ncbi:MAG: hypothetical protein ACYDAQ_17135 [Mycobacteriales bacterium]
MRIEGLLCCHFFALIVQALIEREVRTVMRNAELDQIPLYPELRACSAPSAERILEVFAGVSGHRLYVDRRLAEVFQPELTPLQQQVLDLLGVAAPAYHCPSAAAAGVPVVPGGAMEWGIDLTSSRRGVVQRAAEIPGTRPAPPWRVSVSTPTPFACTCT